MLSVFSILLNNSTDIMLNSKQEETTTYHKEKQMWGFLSADAQ
jgi:hypothetical protein